MLSQITRPTAQIDDGLRALDDGSARLLTPEDDDWPLGRLTVLASLGVPLALWVRGSGSLAELTKLAVTVTGARASSAYGNTIAADLSYELARAGVTVVSGGGLGVDAEAAPRSWSGTSSARGSGTSFNNESGLIYMRVTGNNGEVVTAPAFEYMGVRGFILTADLGVDGGVRDATEMTVDVFARKTGGPGDIVIQLRSKFSFSKPTL